MHRFKYLVTSECFDLYCLAGPVHISTMVLYQRVSHLGNVANLVGFKAMSDRVGQIADI
jgi:hypothetical protein